MTAWNGPASRKTSSPRPQPMPPRSPKPVAQRRPAAAPARSRRSGGTRCRRATVRPRGRAGSRQSPPPRTAPRRRRRGRRRSFPARSIGRRAASLSSRMSSARCKNWRTERHPIRAAASPGNDHAPPRVIWRCAIRPVTNPQQRRFRAMGALDAVSIGILLAALLILAGILSSLVALRFGAPLLLVFLLVGMLAGEAGPLGIKFDDVRLAYTIGSVALALILFDGGLRTRYQTLPQRDRPGGPAGDRRRAGDRRADRAGGGLCARARLDRGAAGRRRGRLDRRRRGVLPAARQGVAAAAARQRDARGRIRHQRSVRDLSHHRADRDHPPRRQAVARDRLVPGRGDAGRGV